MTRSPIAAGTFYPADPSALAATVDSLLDDARSRRSPSQVAGCHEALRALVAPHAAYEFSGPIAASAFALAPEQASVVLLGPSHFVPLAGMAVSGADAWATPLGEVRVSSRLRKAALSTELFVDDEPHERDHALEVVLPFLQRACPRGLEILPVAVGSTLTADVARLLDALDAFVVVSTDLSHHHPDEAARLRDRATADAILRYEPHELREDDACGVFALRGVVKWAKEQDLEIELLDLRTSADTTGERESVVGYGAFAISSRNPSG